jgi:hypothetical protein
MKNFWFSLFIIILPAGGYEKQLDPIDMPQYDGPVIAFENF